MARKLQTKFILICRWLAIAEAKPDFARNATLVQAERKCKLFAVFRGEA
ncbi:MAG: hypothetical protein IKR25_04975 [Muribaculaceae bacterium]|nr:hypothetical protein [Muribaculaceae bacterium]